MDPFAFEDVAPPGGRMSKCAGAIGGLLEQMTHRMSPDPKAPKAHPVETVPPRLNVPPAFIVISWADEEANVPPLPALVLNTRPLIASLPTSVGLAVLLTSTMSRVPAPKVKVALAERAFA